MNKTGERTRQGTVLCLRLDLLLSLRGQGTVPCPHDENGSAYGFLVYENGAMVGEYYYIFNVQGDVIGILDSTGTKVVEYTYNAWGEILSTTGTLADTIGQKNPLRYRGYYFDSETGFYYLQSRYYDPLTGRFINADGYISTGQGMLGTNMFAYCGNNPVNYCDPSGCSFLGFVGVGILFFGMVSLLASSDKDTVLPPKDFREDNTMQNCYGYAFDMKNYGGNPGQHSDGVKLYENSNTCSKEEVTSMVLRDMEALNRNVRTVDSPKDKKDNEYIVALNVQTKIIKEIKHTDFHFAVQLSNGKWADKTPSFPARYGNINGQSKIWYIEPIYYDSHPVFFAVEK